MLLSKKLNQRAKVLVAAGALAVVTLAAIPGAAEAQQEGAQDAKPSAQPATPVQAMPEPAQRAVVNPGDSLWSISQRQLGPNATPEQIATEVERTFELNRNRIGEDPNLILAGQELLLPPAPEPMNAAAFSTPAASSPAAKESSDKPAEPPANEPAVEASAEPAASSPAEPVASDPATSESEPAAAASTGSALGLSERQLLGLGIIALTLVLAVLMLWKLPLRRDVGSGAWRMPAAREYPTNYSASQAAPTAASARRAAFAPSGSENGSGGFGNGALTNGQSHRRVDIAGAAVGRRRKNPPRSRASLSRRPLGKGWAAAVYSPQVRSSLKHATRTKPQGATTAVGRRRKNPPRSRASLSRRPLGKGWAAAAYSPQVRRSLEHAIRTETQSAGAR